MSDESNDDTDKNTTIKDKDSDKKFFASLGTWLVVLTVNIMLGSYIIYASKILHVIQLPTNLDAPPYTNTKEYEQEQKAKTRDAAAKTPPSIYIIPRIKEQMNPVQKNIVGINYLDTIIQPPQNEVVDDTTVVNTATTPLLDNDTNNPPGTRVPYFTKIYVNPNDYKNIFNETDFLGSSLYKKQTGIVYLCLLIIRQQYYFYIYYIICYFFSFIYDNSKGSYLKESIMLLVGFPLFLLYSILTVSLLAPLVPIWFFLQVPKLWTYECTENGLQNISDKKPETFVETVGLAFKSFGRFLKVILMIVVGINLLVFIMLFATVFWPTFGLPYIFYIFYKIISINCQIINTPDNPPDPVKIVEKPASIFWLIAIAVIIVCNLIPVPGFVSLIFPLILIINYLYDAYNMNATPQNYSVATLLLSKIEVITYVIAIIFLWCTKTSYGWNVFGIVCAVVLLLIFLSWRNLIQFIFYPFIVDPKITSLFIKVPDNYMDNETTSCYMQNFPKKNNDNNDEEDEEWKPSIFGFNMAKIFDKILKLNKKNETSLSPQLPSPTQSKSA